MRLLLALLLSVHASLAMGQQDMSEIDPWESTNRKIFAFNRFFDRTLLRPVSSSYAKVMPDAAERSVANAVANIYEVNRFINSLLQGRPDSAAISTGRFMVNTTVGVFGLFDVATRMGIEVQRADFGQTLMVWGFDSGPYVILPFFGPRTVRSATGYFVDTYASIPAVAWNTDSAYAFWTVEAISFRAGLLDYDDLITGDEYVFMRSAYLQARATFLNNGIPPLEDFADDEYDLDWDE
ncbi:MAG: VacJ family lipoprotein [Halieaceae bacterium]|jgi:phospholipid-binding lipoprotein MlaA|nr:VacJ family lipoprotein [Halieaceae bacterium]